MSPQEKAEKLLQDGKILNWSIDASLRRVTLRVTDLNGELHIVYEDTMVPHYECYGGERFFFGYVRVVTFDKLDTFEPPPRKFSREEVDILGRFPRWTT